MFSKKRIENILKSTNKNSRLNTVFFFYFVELLTASKRIENFMQVFSLKAT